MYYYIYDSFLTDRKFDRVLATIETRLTDLGISGKIGRLTPFTSARGLIRDEVKRGAKTIVAVGNDETVAQVVEGIKDEDITLGVIPVGMPNTITRALGIPEGVDACDVLSKRVRQRIDLGSLNGKFFLSDVRVPKGDYTMEGDGMYRIHIVAPESETVVSNLRRTVPDPDDGAAYVRAGDPKDGFLDAFITTRQGGISRFFGRTDDNGSSVIPFRHLEIESDDPISVFADGRKVTNSRFSIEVVPDRLKVITGRERAFT